MNIDINSVMSAASDIMQQTRLKDNISEFRISEDGKYLLVPLKENSTVRVIDEPSI
jgi:tricorn protease-like protein